MAYAILRTAKHATVQSVRASITHQLRERHTANADASKTHLNINSHENTENALQALKMRFSDDDYEVKMKGANVAIEYLITTSHDVPDDFDEKAYFDDALQYIKEKHGADNVIFSSMQYDETTPHMAVIVTPRVFVDEKRGTRTLPAGDVHWKIPAHYQFSTKQFLDGKDKLRELQTDFFNKVGKQQGLERGIKGSTAKHEDVKRHYNEVNTALKIADNSKIDDATKLAQYPHLAAIVKNNKVTIRSNLKKQKELKRKEIELIAKESQHEKAAKKLRKFTASLVAVAQENGIDVKKLIDDIKNDNIIKNKEQTDKKPVFTLNKDDVIKDKGLAR